MFLKRLKLKNIRSYTEQDMCFEQGITLLAGDIGSGKTTILLALEFALFGILRGKMSPQELLRHGENIGSVELYFELQGKGIRVQRALRRRGSTIQQLPGELEIDGQVEELVPTEMKAKILSLMGYPESLIGKSTNLFRYTVYTPQEQVKLILHESVDERKDVIRKIFQIDKYQRIKENMGYYSSYLREHIAHLKGQTDDIKTLKEQLQAQKNELEQLHKNFPQITQKKKEVEQELQKLEDQLKLLREKKEQQQKSLQQKQLLEKEILFLGQQITQQEKQLHSAKKDVQKVEVPMWTSERKVKLQELLKKCREKRVQIQSKIGILKEQEASFVETGIEHLTTCPTCKQQVSSEHKDKVKHEYVLKQDASKKKQKQYLELLHQVAEKEQRYEEHLQKERDMESKVLLLKQKRDQQKQQELQWQAQEKHITQSKGKLQLLEQQLATLAKTPEQVISFTEKETKERELRVQLRQIDSQFSSMQTRIEVAKKREQQLQTSINQKEKLLQQSNRSTQIRSWVQELVTPLLGVIEKRVLLRVYQEFQNYFTSWFDLLVDDQELEVRLDEDFTPLVVQRGFDTGIDNLSGGEKTGVALAYRLALNKVLNDYFSSLHTKGLLILDEPTDGFSSEQIDRLREVFEQIGVQQLFLVSHEPRLESVADQVVRVHKQNHQSLVDF